MTCYFRHLQHIFEKAGIEVTKQNRQEIDRVIHSIVGTKYKNCSGTWREVKKIIADNEVRFVSELKEALSKNV